MVRRHPKFFVLIGSNPFAEESGIPMNLKCGRYPELASAWWQFVFQVNQNGLGFAAGGANIDIEFFPRAVWQFYFQHRQWKRKALVERCRHICHAAPKAQPAV